MKTSNILIMAAVILGLLTLSGYDLFIRQTFISGQYKIPYYHYSHLNFKNFDRVTVVSSTVANVRFVQGPFSVLVDPDAADYIKISQLGKQLTVSVAFPGNSRGNGNDYALIISCPTLRELYTSATWLVSEKPITDTAVPGIWKMREVIVDGFSQDSLHISQDYGSTVELQNNSIRSLNAMIGISPESAPDLSIRKNNQIIFCTVTARQKAKLSLENAAISTLHYSIGDSAKIMVSGNAQHLLLHPKTDLK